MILIDKEEPVEVELEQTESARLMADNISGSLSAEDDIMEETLLEEECVNDELITDGLESQSRTDNED